jgi:hypothetical protein
MRRVAAIVAALVTVLAVAGIAYAQAQNNTYAVQATVTPTGKGTKKKPNPVGVKFNYQVNEAAGLQPAAVKTYKIDFYGVKTNGARFPKCTFQQISQAQSGDNCPAGSQVGSGNIQSTVYTTGNPSDPNSFPCAKSLAVYNSGAGKAVLLLTGPGDQCAGVSQPFIIDAKYVSGSGGGSALQFDVPPTVLHPIPQLTVAVRSVTSSIKKLRKTVGSGKKKRTYGYYESVGCLGSSRPVKVTFTQEDGKVGSASTTSKCSKK